MNLRSVLVVCVGNICRSPVGERALAADLAARGAEIMVSSAGLGALVGHGADATASTVAARHGVSLDGHVARQFTRALGQAHELILVMEPGHRQEIARLAPDLSGRVMLFDHWCGGKGIADPYRRSAEFHEAVFGQIRDGASLWAEKLTYKAYG
ncbi:MAG: low molecular weight phosphotyrosine protein phosphatase [Roseinatronobacter sp.]|jgi:protein-tyrosine phosphatase|nr:low molecular weight phosphotyrosine protein phosphatase [Roseinatronobacter sp.]